MIDVDRSGPCAPDSAAGTPSGNRIDDYTEYMADMILEMQRMAMKFGRLDVAEQLLKAYKVAREPVQQKK